MTDKIASILIVSAVAVCSIVFVSSIAVAAAKDK